MLRTAYVVAKADSLIEVLYDATANNGTGAVRVETFGPHSWHWTSYSNIAVTFVAGDQFGAQALANGEVRIYKNGQLVGSQTLNAADQAFFNGKEGRIGLWFMGGAYSSLRRCRWRNNRAISFGAANTYVAERLAIPEGVRKRCSAPLRTSGDTTTPPIHTDRRRCFQHRFS